MADFVKINAELEQFAKTAFSSGNLMPSLNDLRQDQSLAQPLKLDNKAQEMLGQLGLNNVRFYDPSRVREESKRILENRSGFLPELPKDEGLEIKPQSHESLQVQHAPQKTSNPDGSSYHIDLHGKHTVLPDGSTVHEYLDGRKVTEQNDGMVITEQNGQIKREFRPFD